MTTRLKPDPKSKSVKIAVETATADVNSDTEAVGAACAWSDRKGVARECRSMHCRGNEVSQKRKPKLPPEWHIYVNADRKPIKRKGVALWKYAVWVAVLMALAGIAFFPWSR